VPEKKNKILVTKTTLPGFKKYSEYLETIWKNNWITNHGPLANELERRLRKYLGVPDLYFVSNGTVALEIAIKALKLKGEIITTPFSYVATTSSIVWTDCEPKFADINNETFNIDPEKIEKAVTKRTTAILATHVYGNPCSAEKINAIAKRHKLKVIYDAAHSFGVKYLGKSILNYGDVSTLSFHATKLFHTAEGGAVVTGSKDLAHKIAYSRNFGHNGEEAFWGLGINGKNSELHAAIGLSLLDSVKGFIKDRKKLSKLYDSLLINTGLQRQVILPGTEYNYSYYPVVFPKENILIKVRRKLNESGIFPRRYFYPPLNKLNYVKYMNCPAAESISKRVLCLPLYTGLEISSIEKICKIIIKNL
jgi:dTDP-4-amino-4,6-dideoxygalactose transaminase